MARFPVALFLSAIIPVIAFSRSAAEGVYTKEQAARGQVVYGEECAKCHAENLAGGDGSPELTGPDFLRRWNGKTVGALFEFMRKTMPTDDPGHLSMRQYSDLAAYILKANDFPAGSKELDRDLAALNEIRIEAKQ
jgi:mono/diheme cytochrome c family protein